MHVKKCIHVKMVNKIMTTHIKRTCKPGTLCLWGDCAKHHTTMHNTIQCNTVQYSTIQYNTIQCNI